MLPTAQLTCICIHWGFNIGGLVLVNRYKARTDGGSPLDLLMSRTSKDQAVVAAQRLRFTFALHYALFALLLLFTTTIDSIFPPASLSALDLNLHLFCIDIKAFAAAFTMGVLDFLLSSNGVKQVPLASFPGCLLWCSCVILRDVFASVYFPTVPMLMAQES